MRISTPEIEGELSVSKWLKHQVLLDSDEMKDLLEHLSPFYCCLTGQVVENGIVLQEDFLKRYAEYIENLKEGKIIPRKFSYAWTTSLDLLYAMQVKNKVLLKPLKPVIILQTHQFLYSNEDKEFHPMVLSKESISWGIQFSYPQIYEDPKTHEFFKVVNSEEFPNTALFLKLARWLRINSQPTPFLAEGKKVNVPIRIGKQVLSWINIHPELKAKGLTVCQ